MLVNYQSHRIATEIFPEDADAFSFNSTTRKDCISFVNHPDAIVLMSSTCNITTTPTANTGLADNFKVACSHLQESHFSNLQLDKELKHAIETALCYDPEVEYDLNFTSLFREVVSENIINDLVLLSRDEFLLLHCQSGSTSHALSYLNISHIQPLQFYLNNLQEKEICSVNSDFYYCSIEREASWDFWSSNENALVDGQDPRLSHSKTNEFALNEPD